MQTLLAQGPADFAWDQGVQRDYSQRVVFDHIVQEILTRKVAVRNKRLAHRFARVVIAGNDEDRHA